MNIRADFHSHTTASDGKLEAKALIKLAKEEGLNFLSITDHDTTASIDTAMSEAKKLGIKFIPGIELSTIHNGESIHVLGYFRDDSYRNMDFQKFLKEMQEFRIYRAKKFVDNLDKFFNIKLDYEEVAKNAKGVIARPHIARAIIDKGYNYSWDYIFDKIIGKNSPAYVHNKKISVEEGISMLRDLNAVVVLAHPKLIKKTPVEEFMKLDFHGIEAIYYLNSEEEEERFIKLADTHNKVITCGSDFHGNGKEDTKHGFVGSVESPYSLIKPFLDLFNF